MSRENLIHFTRYSRDIHKVTFPKKSHVLRLFLGLSKDYHEIFTRYFSSFASSKYPLPSASLPSAINKHIMRTSTLLRIYPSCCQLDIVIFLRTPKFIFQIKSINLLPRNPNNLYAISNYYVLICM